MPFDPAPAEQTILYVPPFVKRACEKYRVSHRWACDAYLRADAWYEGQMRRRGGYPITRPTPFDKWTKVVNEMSKYHVRNLRNERRRAGRAVHRLDVDQRLPALGLAVTD